MFCVFFPRERAFSDMSSFLSLPPCCREESAKGKGEKEQEEEADRKSPGATQRLPSYRQS